MTQFEQVGCLFQHASPPELLFERPDWWLGLPGRFAWNRCPECGLLFLSPRPTAECISDYYPHSYAAYRPAIDDEPWPIMRWKRRRNLRGQIEAVNQRASPGFLLDVGCATGNFLAEMRSRGWQVRGVELQAEAAQYARQRLGLDVFTGDLLESHLPGNAFDVVTMWDVLEHTFNPLSVLREAQHLLKPGGLLVFSIPDLNSKEANTFGPAWIGYDAPRHLYLFAGASLDLLLAQSGFAHLDSRYFLATYHTWVASLHTKLNSRAMNQRLRRLLLRMAYLPLWSPLTAPYFTRLNRSGRGTVMTVFAQATAAQP